MKSTDNTHEYKAYRPNPLQAQFLVGIADPSTTIKIAVGGVGSGKTQAIVQAAFEAAATLPGNEIAIARKTHKDVMKTTYREFMRTVPRAWILSERKTDSEVFIRTSDSSHPSRITFAGMDDPDTWDSTQFGQVFWDEGNKFDYEDFIKVRQRMRHPLPDGVNIKDSPFSYYDNETGKYDMYRFLVIATNPITHVDHWLRKLYKTSSVDGKTYKTFMIRIPTYDNAKNLSKVYLETLEDQPEEERRRTIWAEDTIGLAGPACTPNYIDKPMEQGGHLFSGPFPNYPMHMVRGWDFGYRHPSISWGEVVGKGALYIWAETYTERLTLDQLIRDLVLPLEAQMHEDTTFAEWVDHQAANQMSDKSLETCRKIMRTFGMNGRSRYSKPRDRAQLLDDMFRNRRLFIHESCKWHRAAFAGGWQRDDNGEPIKDGAYDHVGDSAGYLAFNEFGATGMKFSRSDDREQPGNALEDAPYTPKGNVIQRLFRLPGMGRAS